MNTTVSAGASSGASDIKTVTIVGDIKTITGGKKRIGRITRKAHGGSTATIAATAPQQTALPITISKTNIPPPPVIPITTEQPRTQQQAGALPKIRIAPKRRTHRIILIKKQHRVGGGAEASTTKHRTQRRLSIATNQLQSRVHKANNTRKASRTLPIDKIRETLVDKKIIKPTSKAPEDMLRQMYSDSMIVSQRAL